MILLLLFSLECSLNLKGSIVPSSFSVVVIKYSDTHEREAECVYSVPSSRKPQQLEPERTSHTTLPGKSSGLVFMLLLSPLFHSHSQVPGYPTWSCRFPTSTTQSRQFLTQVLRALLPDNQGVPRLALKLLFNSLAPELLVIVRYNRFLLCWENCLCLLRVSLGLDIYSNSILCLT